MISEEKSSSAAEKPSSRQENVQVRLAEGPEEIEAIQKLRYPFFRKSDASGKDHGKDVDKFDDIADHLIVIDKRRGKGPNSIVGTYRLIKQDVAEKHGGFYTSCEYDISCLTNRSLPALELGRSCVLEEYRVKPVIQMLWDGISEYVIAHNIGTIFGCGSFTGTTDISEVSKHLSYLHHRHLAPEKLRAIALPDRYIDMNLHSLDELDEKRIFSSLPPLLKGYLRIGSFIGDGAVIDYDLNMIDVCIILDMKHVVNRYKSHYEKRNKKPLPTINQN